jgi:predicted permease
MKSMWTIRQDILFAIRLFRRDKWFAAVAVLTLGVGIAVNTTVFGWIDTVLLHPFPCVGDAGELALIETVTPDGEYLVNTSVLDYLDYRSNLKLVSGVALGRFTPLNMGPPGRAHRAWAELVSPNYFDVLQVKPILGRAFGPDEKREQEGANPVAVISYRIWQNQFHGDPNILGKNILLNRNRLTIIGVAPPGFRGSLAGVMFDVWAPVTLATAMGTGNGTLHFRGTRDETSTIVRLKPGVRLEQARAEVAALGRRLADMYPATNRGVDLTLTPLRQGHLGTQGILGKPLGILMAVCVLLLLIACANVANLLLARAVSRQRELGIRMALGARPIQVTRQLLIETLLLAAGGAFAGVFLAMGLGRTLPWLMAIQDIPLALGGGINAASLAFTVGLTIATTLISGLAPAVMAARSDLDETLKEAGRGGGSGRKSHRLRRLLVAAEMGMAIVVLIGAGLLWRSFRNASAIQPGFDRTNVSVSQFYLSYAGYTGPEQWQFCRELRSRMEAKPGVVGVTYSDVVPMSLPSGGGLTPWHKLEIPGYTPSPNEQMMIHRATVPPGYFGLLGISMLAGRDFTENDSADKPLVMIVNEAFARRFFHGSYPVGRKLKFEGNVATIVGLVKNSKYHTPTEGPLPFFYLPFRQWFYPGLNFSVLMKTAGDPLKMTPVLRREALALNQDAAFTTRTLSEANAGSLSNLNVGASLLSAVGVLSLLMAAIGLYSVMSCAVNQRTQELGIRMALGAQPRQVLSQVLGEALVMTAPGVVAGMVLSLAAADVLSDMLVSVSVSDPLTFAGAAVFLGLVAAIASYFPARRATKCDPMASLRSS